MNQFEDLFLQFTFKKYFTINGIFYYKKNVFPCPFLWMKWQKLSAEKLKLLNNSIFLELLLNSLIYLWNNVIFDKMLGNVLTLINFEIINKFSSFSERPSFRFYICCLVFFSSLTTCTLRIHFSMTIVEMVHGNESNAIPCSNILTDVIPKVQKNKFS